MATPEIWTIQRAANKLEYAEFRDQDGWQCNLQQTGRPDRLLLGQIDHEMALSREQVALLMYNLSHWLEYGTMMAD